LPPDSGQPTGLGLRGCYGGLFLDTAELPPPPPYDDKNQQLAGYRMDKWLVNKLILGVGVVCADVSWEAVIAATTLDPFKQDVKVEDTRTRPVFPISKLSHISKASSSNTPFTMAAESVITFVSVFVVGIVITLSVYSWKRFKPTTWRYNFFNYFLKINVQINIQITPKINC
jgi:hypothetical protein